MGHPASDEVLLAALEKATAIVDAMSKTPTNDRGYKVDGWRPPSLGERTEAILKLATFLVNSPPLRQANLVAPRSIQEESQ